jgi:Pyruvate/2-oxoacid:ferredoxin oxidoreductase delta subunit
MNIENFNKKFQVPEVARPFVDKIFTEEEMDFVDRMDKDVFTLQEAKEIIDGDAIAFINNTYRRGIVSLVDELTNKYKIADFYSRLDIFAVSEQEVYRSIPKEGQIAMDDWYFDTYFNGLNSDKNIRPTEDEILPLDKVLEFIDEQDRPIYLNYCDCRSLRGDCGKPTQTCITYRDGINTFAHRGISEKIHKERAKEIVIDTDKKGLMHTVNPNGICNCCGECCYLFRSQTQRGSVGFWPKTMQIIKLDEESCIGCGACMKRCHFDVFSENDGHIIADISKCVGCGICANTCPTKSLSLEARE